MKSPADQVPTCLAELGNQAADFHSQEGHNISYNGLF